MTASRTNWTAVVFGLSLSFLAAYQMFKLPPVLPVLLETYRYDRTLAGGFMSVYAVAGLCFSVLFGRLMQRHGPALPVLAALSLMVVGNGLVLAWPGQGWLFLGARALEGVAFALLAIVGPTLANRAASRRHLPLIIGLTATWIPAGQLAASLIAPAGLALAGWPSLWIVAIAVTLVTGLWTVKLMTGARAALALHPRSGYDPTGPVRLSRGERLGLMLASAVFMLWSSQYFAYMTWLPQYLVEVTGLSVSRALAGYILPVTVLLIFNVATGVLLRAGAPLGPLMVAALVLQAAIWWLHPAVDGPWTGIAALVLYGVGAGITPTCLFAMPSALAGPDRAAAAFGILMTGRNVGVLIGPILLAQAFKLTGSWDVSAPIFGTLTALSVLLAVALAIRLSRGPGGAGQGTRR